jgi:DNA-binding transcriptional ArsR family regulator
MATMDLNLSNAMIDEIGDLFRALGDSSRLKILKCLLAKEQPLSQGSLAEATGLSQANASKHLACMVRVGLVTREAKGNTVYFSPTLPLAKDLCNLVCGHVTDRTTKAYHALR